MDNVISWHTKCAHCGHPMRSHGLDWGLDTFNESDCIEFDCECPGFEPAKEDDDGI